MIFLKKNIDESYRIKMDDKDKWCLINTKYIQGICMIFEFGPKGLEWFYIKHINNKDIDTLKDNTNSNFDTFEDVDTTKAIKQFLNMMLVFFMDLNNV